MHDQTLKALSLKIRDKTGMSANNNPEYYTRHPSQSTYARKKIGVEDIDHFQMMRFCILKIQSNLHITLHVRL